MELTSQLSTPIKFELYRVPFLLEPGYDESETFKETHMQRMRRNFDGPSGYDHQGYEKFKKGCRLAERGKTVGIGKNGSLGWNDYRICSNTIKSHRLIQYIFEKYGWRVSETLFDVLNAEHFLYGKNLNETKFLLSCCKKIGLDIQPIKLFLESNEGRDHIINMVQTLRDHGLDHIPVFIINNSVILDGAPTASSFVAAFRKIEHDIAINCGDQLIHIPTGDDEETMGMDNCISI